MNENTTSFLSVSVFPFPLLILEELASNPALLVSVSNKLVLSLRIHLHEFLG